jgi:hypothetical protein
MHMNEITRTSVGADYGLSRKKTDDESGPSPVTLSAAKGLSRRAESRFAALNKKSGHLSAIQS